MQQDWIYDRNKTVCFTGHRQEKLPDNGDYSSQKMKTILSMLYYEIHKSIEEGYDTYIVGGSRGIDLIAAEFVYQFIHQGKKIRLIVAMPYRGFGSNFKGRDLFMRGNALAEAEQVFYVSENYFGGCYKKRNKFMVDHSSRIIGVVSDMTSGTGQTIRLAEDSGLDIHIINTNTISQLIDDAKNEDVEIVEEKTQMQNVIKLYYRENKNKDDEKDKSK